MDSLFHMQAEFMKAGEVPIKTTDAEVLELTEDLVIEEFFEWAEEDGGTVNEYKEALDLLYVTLQWLNARLGPDLAFKAFKALHGNNMSKCIDGALVKREDGKVLKPANYQPLDLTPLLEEI